MSSRLWAYFFGAWWSGYAVVCRRIFNFFLCWTCSVIERDFSGPCLSIVWSSVRWYSSDHQWSVTDRVHCHSCLHWTIHMLPRKKQVVACTHTTLSHCTVLQIMLSEFRGQRHLSSRMKNH